MKDRWDEVTAAVADVGRAAGWEVGDCHDLLHRAFSPVCWTLLGGPARHVSLWWQYRGGAGVRRHLHCRVGRHHYLPYWSDGGGPQDTPDGFLCRDCG